MDTAFTEEQDDIRRTVAELLAKRCGSDEIRAAVATADGYDRTLWQQLAERLGLPGLAVPVAYGGVGCGAVELAVACEEAGRVLLPSPLLGSAVLGAPLIRALGTEEQRAELLPGIASGALTVALAAPMAALGLTGANDGDWAGGGRAGGVQARRVGPGKAGWRLYGQVEQVLGGHSAEVLLVAAHTGGFARSRTLLFVVRAAGAAGLVRARRTALDETRSQARVELRDVEAALLGEEDAGVEVAGELAGAGAGAAAALAAEAVGAADGALARTVDYVKVREQFGRPIGSFQAVRHRLADVYVQIATARSAAYYAAACEPGEAGGLALAQGLAALRLAAAEAVQLHGGLGFTWEHDAQLYFKRAAGDELLFGPVHALRARAAERAEVFA
ncbi:acyl-CoA dehydrogenase family protein [Streptomyces gobiensis]|uniref:acyl-CoA dehydrogenase family protein n=1 Tax=Streptomyces gobiensis TaxID=2875706 RepID=UPI001E500801|nr:acyl-CoA dehydrogenase family protein [Streptomyces gobiensis]UGY92006.1 acyl-CoA/acyl-ACP dehydrogenase [Streptomyces gobiensis]